MGMRNERYGGTGLPPDGGVFRGEGGRIGAMIPVVDIFAGPGGLSEGFSSIIDGDRRLFPIRLSVESKEDPAETLRIRHFFRQFPIGKAPEEYYMFLRGEIDREGLIRSWPEHFRRADDETFQATIGESDQDALDDRLTAAIGGTRNWILVGGPPCQAYSNAGKVGNRTRKDYRPEKDTRYGLYKEFIRILGTHIPAAFVLENVPGMLSARSDDRRIIDDILLGLSRTGGLHPQGVR